MFRSQNFRLRFNPEAGQLITVQAKLSLFEARGDYQLIVDSMEHAGDGALAQAFENLKRRLEADGLFDPASKKSLPAMPMHVAVITSATGAAFHDILTVLARRFPLIRVTLLPASVQGEHAPLEMIAAIELANFLAANGQQDFALIILGRGGGSLEDLWAFNNEHLARVIHHSALPIVSAVGHEVDFTIADFVADVRAPTPSAAAELVSADAEEWLATLLGYEQQLQRLWQQHITEHHHHLRWLRSRLRHPGRHLQEQQQRLDDAELRLGKAWISLANGYRHRAALLEQRFMAATPARALEQLKYLSSQRLNQLRLLMRYRLEKAARTLNTQVQLLDSVSPLATLKRGYAIVTNNKKEVLRSAKAVKPGDEITAQLEQGTIHAQVK